MQEQGQDVEINIAQGAEPAGMERGRGQEKQETDAAPNIGQGVQLSLKRQKGQQKKPKKEQKKAKKEQKKAEKEGYVCLFCAWKDPHQTAPSFTRKGLEDHCGTVHGNIRYKCRACHNVFSTEAELTEHKRNYPKKH